LGVSEQDIRSAANSGMPSNIRCIPRGSCMIRPSVVITFYDTRVLSRGCYQDSCTLPFAAGLDAVGPGWNINLPLTL